MTLDLEEFPYREAMDRFERRFLESVKKRCRSTQEMGAQLNIDRSTVRRKMNRLGIPLDFDE